MATPPPELQTCAEQVARLLGRDDATPASLKLLVAPHHSIKSLWGRLVRGRPAVLLQRAVTLAQLAHLRQSNGTRLRPSPLIWVDDRPVGNSKEASELRALGLDVKQVTSTAEALAIATEGSYFVTDSFRPDDGLEHAAAQLIRSIRAVPSLAASPVLIYVGAEPLDLISLISAQPPVMISNNPSVLEEFARCLLPRPALPLAPLGSANPNPNPNPSANANANASPSCIPAAAAKAPPPLVSMGSTASSSSSSSFIDHRDEPMLEKQPSHLPDRKRSRDDAELKEASSVLPLTKQISVPPLAASLSIPSLSPSLSLSPFLLKENQPQQAQVALQWQVQGELRAGDKCVVSVALPPNAPPVELWLTGARSCPAFGVPSSGQHYSPQSFYLLPVAPGPAMLELRLPDHSVYSSHNVTVLPYLHSEPPAAQPKQSPQKQQRQSTHLAPAPSASSLGAASQPPELRSSDPLSLLSAVDMPNPTRRRVAPVDSPPPPSTPPLPTAGPSPVSNKYMKAVVEEEAKAKDEDTGGTEEIPELGGTLPLPSDEGGDSPVKASPRNDHGGASAGISATVPLPD